MNTTTEDTIIRIRPLYAVTTPAGTIPVGKESWTEEAVRSVWPPELLDQLCDDDAMPQVSAPDDLLRAGFKIQAEGPSINRSADEHGYSGVSDRVLADWDDTEDALAFLEGLDYDHVTLAVDQYTGDTVSYKYYAEVTATLEGKTIRLSDGTGAADVAARQDGDPTPLALFLHARDGGFKDADGFTLSTN